MRFKRIFYHIKIYFLKYLLGINTMSLELKRCTDRGVKIGENMKAFSLPLSSEPYLLEFGDNVTIAANVRFLTHDNSAIKVIDNSTDIFGRIKIGNNCFIGHSSIILPGVELGNNVIVGAGSVVTKSFQQDGVITGGNPAKIIGNIEEYKSNYNCNAFNIKGLTRTEVKELILSNQDKLIVK